MATFIFRSTVAPVENLSGDGGPDAQARSQLAMQTSWARAMMFAPSSEVNPEMVDALQAEGVSDRTVGLHVHVDPANEQAVQFMTSALGAKGTFGKKDAIKALKAGKTVVVFAGPGVESKTFDDVEVAATALGSWAAEVAVQAPLDLNANARGGGSKTKKKKKKKTKASAKTKKKKAKKAKKDNSDL